MFHVAFVRDKYYHLKFYLVSEFTWEACNMRGRCDFIFLHADDIVTLPENEIDRQLLLNGLQDWCSKVNVSE